MNGPTSVLVQCQWDKISNNILLKTIIYPDIFTAKSQEEEAINKIISKVIKAKQKCVIVVARKDMHQKIAMHSAQVG